jgi:hypothetical protein
MDFQNYEQADLSQTPILLQLEQYIEQKRQKKMEENTTTIGVILGAVGGLAAAVGFPKLWEHWFGHLSNKHAATLKNDGEIMAMREEIRILKEKNTRIVTAVELLMIVIQHQFKDNPNIEQAIAKVEEHLHDGIVV